MIKFQTDIILKSIHYTGKTIGRNFTIKIKINGSSKTLNKQLKPNYVNECYDLIYTKSLDSLLKRDITILKSGQYLDKYIQSTCNLPSKRHARNYRKGKSYR